jgi:hypothetical protein
MNKLNTPCTGDLRSDLLNPFGYQMLVHLVSDAK